MPVYPVGVLVHETPTHSSLFAFAVEGMNLDEAEGRAHRIVRKCFGNKPYLLKVNSEPRPIDPEHAHVEEPEGNHEKETSTHGQHESSPAQG